MKASNINFYERLSMESQKVWRPKVIASLSLSPLSYIVDAASRKFHITKWFDENGRLYFYSLDKEGQPEYRTSEEARAYGRQWEKVNRERRKLVEKQKSSVMGVW